MKVEDIHRFLQNLGLSEYEAKAYSSLSMTGPMKAGDLSRDSRVPQSKIYWVLEELIDKQLVEVSEGRPKEYRVVPAETALRRLVEEKEKSVSSAKSRMKEISGYLKPMNTEETVGGIWTIRGRDWVEFFNKAAEMINRSRKYIYGVTRDFSRSAKIADAVNASTKRGVKIRVVGMEPLNAENFFKAKWYEEHGIETRILETKLHPRIILVDGKEVLMRLDHRPDVKEGFQFSSVWSADPSLVKVLDIYLKNVWENAKKIDFNAAEKQMTSKL